MSSGQAVEPKAVGGGPSVKQFLAQPFPYAPGSYSLYNTMGTYVLSAIVTKVTGQTALEYLKPRLFDPLGIEDPRWDSSPEGNSLGGYGLYLRTEDMAKFGQLMLRHAGGSPWRAGAPGGERNKATVDQKTRTRAHAPSVVPDERSGFDRNRRHRVETIQVVLTEYGPDLRCFPTETLCLACHSGASETDQRGQTGKEKEAESAQAPASLPRSEWRHSPNAEARPRWGHSTAASPGAWEVTWRYSPRPESWQLTSTACFAGDSSMWTKAQRLSKNDMRTTTLKSSQLRRKNSVITLNQQPLDPARP